MSKTFETNAQKALTMASGIKKHIAEVAHLGIKTEGLDTLEAEANKAIEMIQEVDALSDSLDDNSFVIYEIDENTPIYLGYFKLDNTHISLSNLFNTLRHNSILGGTDDPLLALKNEKCLHIDNWVFDKQLGQEKMLDKIFTYITTFVQRPFILWCETDSNLLFHKVNNEPFGQTAAVAYFITYFPKKIKTHPLWMRFSVN